MKKLFTFIIGFILLFSFTPINNNANAATNQLDKVKPSTNISRTLDKDGMDAFYISLNKNQTLNLSIKDAKKKKLSVMIISGISVKQFNAMMDENGEVDESILDDEKMLNALMNMKIQAAIDNLKGEDSVGASKKQFGLKKGNYIVIVDTDSSLKKYGNKYNLSISNSKNKNVEFESNDTLKNANQIKRSQVYKANFFSIFDDVDNFKVNVPEKGNLVVKSTMQKKGDYSFVIYDSNKKRVKKTTKRSGKTYTTQAAVKKGMYYVRVENNEFSLEDTYLNYNIKAFVKTTTPKSSVVNKKGTKNDRITVNNLQKGAKVIVYKDAKKKKVVATRTAKSSKMVIKTKALSDRGGKVYVTVKNKGLYTSSMKKVNYKAAK